MKVKYNVFITVFHPFCVYALYHPISFNSSKQQPNSLVKNILPNGTANIEKSKTSVNMSEYEIPLKSKTNNLSGRPVARNSEIRAWGLNPYILKSKDKPTKVKTTHYVKIKKPLQRNDKQKMCIYSKTTR